MQFDEFKVLGKLILLPSSLLEYSSFSRKAASLCKDI